MRNFARAASWDATTLGEWGLRFWINRCFRAEGGQIARFEAASGTQPSRSAAAPVQVTGHAPLAEVAAQYERDGYFDTYARATDAAVLALRFNPDMTRAGRFALALADTHALAVAGARRALTVSPPPTTPMQSGLRAGGLDAVRDVIGWNTVWDDINRRPYTSIRSAATGISSSLAASASGSRSSNTRRRSPAQRRRAIWPAC